MEILKIHGVKKIDICIHLGSHGASSSSNISFLSRCILPTAEDMNLFMMVTVMPSKGRGKPNSNFTFCSLSKLLIKEDIWVPSDLSLAIIFCLRFDQRDSKLSLKVGQSERKYLTSSTLSLQKRQSSPSVFESQATLPLSPKFPMSLICTWRRLTYRGKCSQDTLEPLAYLDGHYKNETNHLPLFQGF